MSIVETIALNYFINNINILKDIYIKIEKGDYVAVIGPNGGGKSTLISTILGLKDGYTGEVRLFGKPLKEFNDWNKIGFVPQRAIEIDSNFPISVYETIKLGRISMNRKFWQKDNDGDKLILEIMEKLKIVNLKNRLIGELSGGEKQRVMIARALVSQPELLVLDEPNTGIDVATQREFYAILKDLNIKKGLTIMFVTHDIAVIEDSINSIITVNREASKSESPQTLFNCKTIRDIYGIDSHLKNHRH